MREAPGLVEATARVGGASTGWFGYENQAETARFLFETLRQSSTPAASDTNSVAAAGIPPFPATGSGFKDWLDFSLLPPFDKVAKYFHFAVYSVGANVDGLTFKMFAPVPPALKK